MEVQLDSSARTAEAGGWGSRRGTAGANDHVNVHLKLGGGDHMEI